MTKRPAPLGPQEALDKGHSQLLSVAAQVQPVSGELLQIVQSSGRGGGVGMGRGTSFVSGSERPSSVSWGGAEKVGEPCPLLVAGSNGLFGALARCSRRKSSHRYACV